jgi:hypothetical protein
VPSASPATPYEVPVIPLWLMSIVEKLELLETCSWYDVAPLEAFQVNVGLGEIPVAPFKGEASVGAAGGFPLPSLVVKLQEIE